MPIEIQLSRLIGSDAAASDLVETLRDDSASLGLDNAILYYGYPRYRDDDDELIAAQLLLMSPNHGVVIFGTLSSARLLTDETNAAAQAAESVLALVHSKLLANKALRSTPVSLKFPVIGRVYAPNLQAKPHSDSGVDYLTSHADIRKLLSAFTPVQDAVFAQVTASIDGTRSIPRPKKRLLDELPPDSKGALVAQLEAELARFDIKQREGSVTIITGPQRIRGLAGSGKTIVLTRKAALAHLEDPEASIAYTFHTKSLYQQIRRS